MASSFKYEIIIRYLFLKILQDLYKFMNKTRVRGFLKGGVTADKANANLW